MDKILVLMATYNGSKYLKEQIESILNQKGVEISLQIADDCSSDNTCALLEQYEKRHANIHFIRNKKNQGYRLNFFHLIQNASNDYEYYALADQDDVWMENKLITAIDELKRRPKDTPNIYYSNLTVANQDLQPIGRMEKEEDIKNFTRINLLLENKCTGCTAVFNHKMKEYVSKMTDQMILLPHDEIIGRIASLYGEYIYDPNSYIFYRQHQNNQIGVNKKHKLKKYFNFLIQGTKQYHAENIKDLLSLFGKSANIPEAEDVAECNDSIKKRLQVFFSHEIKKRGFCSNIVFKIAILIKKY